MESATALSGTPDTEQTCTAFSTETLVLLFVLFVVTQQSD